MIVCPNCQSIMSDPTADICAVCGAPNRVWREATAEWSQRNANLGLTATPADWQRRQNDILAIALARSHGAAEREGGTE